MPGLYRTARQSNLHKMMPRSQPTSIVGWQVGYDAACDGLYDAQSVVKPSLCGV